MSEEVFQIVKDMNRRDVELQLCLQCAPVISGLKASNLFIVPRDDETVVRGVLKYTGLMSYRLSYDRNRVVFLIFNRHVLSKYITQPEVSNYLREMGYSTNEFGKVLNRFQKRYESFINSKCNFPHEMGVLLGYPLCDVKGFIEHKGREYKLSGYWKVYGDENAAKVLFDSFDHIKDEMILRLSGGESFRDILVSYESIRKIA